MRRFAEVHGIDLRELVRKLWTSLLEDGGWCRKLFARRRLADGAGIRHTSGPVRHNMLFKFQRGRPAREGSYARLRELRCRRGLEGPEGRRN